MKPRELTPEREYSQSVCVHALWGCVFGTGKGVKEFVRERERERDVGNRDWGGVPLLTNRDFDRQGANSLSFVWICLRH